MTMTQKILAKHAGLDSVEAGQLIEADLDLVLANDITGPVAIGEMEKMDVDCVFCKDKIAFYKTPKYFFIVDEFPLTASGKIQKFKLREQAKKLVGIK